MSDVFETLVSYGKDPSAFWEGNERQEVKSEKRINNLLVSYGLTIESLVKIVLAVSKERIDAEVSTVYISSFGSSGSHLFQHVLVDAFNFIGLGEIYLPPRLEKMFLDMPLGDSEILLEAYHLLHARPESIFSNKEVVNTAHKAKLQGFAQHTANLKSAFLLRNPVDICMSRSFRKKEYRDYLGKSELSDEEYLKININKTKKFYRSALDYPYEKYFFYEELISHDFDTALQICRFLGREYEVEKVHGSLVNAVKSGASNKYRGPEINIPKSYFGLARSELDDVIRSYDSLR